MDIYDLQCIWWTGCWGVLCLKILDSAPQYHLIYLPLWIWYLLFLYRQMDSLSFSLFFKINFNLQIKELEEKASKRNILGYISYKENFLMLEWILERNCACKPSFVLEICVSLQKQDKISNKMKNLSAMIWMKWFLTIPPNVIFLLSIRYSTDSDSDEIQM